MDNNCINKNICIELELNTPHIEIELEMGAKGKDGKDATINGVNTLNVVAGNNISLEQEGSTLTISGTYEYDDTGIKNDINEINESLKNYALKENVPTKVSQLENDLKYVKNTDYATSTVAGVIKANAGLDVDKNGMVVADTYNYDEYKSKTDKNFISKGTLENVITGKNLETANNKVTSLGTGSTDIEYPSAKCTYKIKEDLDNLKSDILETGTASDSFINVQDSAWAELQELSVDGVCEQKTTTGTNLCDLNVTQNDKVVYNSDGTITINGSGGFILAFKQFIAKANTKYYIKWELVSGTVDTSKSNGNSFLNPFDNTNIKQDEFKENVIENDKNISGFWINNMAVFTNAVIRIWFSETQSPFEKYTGGQPSPSPEYKQPISTIENSLKITSCNKNLIDLSEFFDTTLNGITITNNRDGSLTLNGTATGNVNTSIIKNKHAKESEFGIYTFKCFGLPSNCYNDVWYGSPRPYGEGISRVEYKNKTDNYAIKLNIPKGTSLTNVIIRPILVKGSYTSNNFPSFEQHLQSQINANLPEGEFIGKIDDTYKDELVAVYNQEEGQYHVMLNKMIGRVVLNGSEAISKSGATTNEILVATLNTNGLVDGHGISNYFIYSPYVEKNKFGIYNNGKNLRFCLDIQQYATIDDFKTWLSTHNTEVYYVLEQPYTVDLGVVDMPLSYDEVTNIFTDSDLLPQINAKYYKNFITTIRNLQVNNDTLKNELVSIENRLAELEKAKENVTNNEEVSI